jgi:hypothetical protein
MVQARVVALLAVVSLTGAACSGGDATESAGDGVGGGDRELASVEAIAPAVSARLGEAAAFEPVNSKTALGQGDQVRTDTTGFAEVVFFDGSWQRVENDVTLTLTELVDIEGGQTVRTGIDRGRAWQRVEALTSDEAAFEVDTPVAVASVRGTAFAIECVGDPITCDFSVVDGEVDVELSSGNSIGLQPGQVLTVAQDVDVGEPRTVGIDALRANPWIAANLARDQQPPGPVGTAPPGQPEPVATGELAAAANDICAEAGDQNEAIATGDASSDEVARQQAAVLAGAVTRLDELDVPAELEARFTVMIDSYRQRIALVEQALVAVADECAGLVANLLDVTATGATAARSLGLSSCDIRSG